MEAWAARGSRRVLKTQRGAPTRNRKGWRATVTSAQPSSMLTVPWSASRSAEAGTTAAPAASTRIGTLAPATITSAGSRAGWVESVAASASMAIIGGP